jgi:hypothetical protein
VGLSKLFHTNVNLFDCTYDGLATSSKNTSCSLWPPPPRISQYVFWILNCLYLVHIPSSYFLGHPPLNLNLAVTYSSPLTVFLASSWLRVTGYVGYMWLKLPILIGRLEVLRGGDRKICHLAPPTRAKVGANRLECCRRKVRFLKLP